MGSAVTAHGVFGTGKIRIRNGSDAYQRVSAAQQKGMECMTAQKRNIRLCKKWQKKCLGESIPHSFGHGVGLEVHEYPTISPKSKGVFWENMIVTAEPGIYFSGKIRDPN
jgi:Xaa-Pro aminopeptidase